MPTTGRRNTRRENASAIPYTIQEVVATASKIAGRSADMVWANYGLHISQVTAVDIRSLRRAKDKLTNVLRLSRERPQFVSVQGRRGEENAEYVILPVERFNELLQAAHPETDEDYMPITELLARVGRTRELPLVNLPEHGERADEMRPLSVIPVTR